MILFRAGSCLLVGEAEESYLDVRYQLIESGLVKIPTHRIVVHESLIINKDFSAEDLALSETSGSRKYDAVVQESLLPLATAGPQDLGGGLMLSSYSPLQRCIGLSEGSDHHNLSFEQVFGNARLSECLALEGLRDSLGSLGLSETHKPCLGYTTTLRRPLHFFMKKDPFRDLARIHEGTVVSVEGYYKGCALVEADGEEFWVPVEESSAYFPLEKDDAFYLNQDSNANKLPDPLEVLPSKVSLDSLWSDTEDNWNSQPKLHRVGGYIHPTDNLTDDDVSILQDFLMEPTVKGVREGYVGTHGYEDDERGQKPELSDISNEPAGEDPDQESAVHDQEYSRIVHSTLKALVKGRDAVDPDDDGDPAGEPGMGDAGVIEAIVAEVLSGADLAHLLEFRVSGEDVDALEQEVWNRVVSSTR